MLRGSNNVIAEAINRGCRRREEKNKNHINESSTLNPEDFTHFMGIFYNQDQEIVSLAAFETP